MALPRKPRDINPFGGFNRRGPGAVSPARAAELEKALAALEDCKAGKQWTTIAKEHGYTSATAAERKVHQLLLSMIDPEDVKAALLEDLAILKDLHSFAWSLAKGGDLFAIDRVLAIMARKHKVLGLDQAPKSQTKAASKDRTVKVTLQMGKTLSTVVDDDEEDAREPVEVSEKDLEKLKTLAEGKGGN